MKNVTAIVAALGIALLIAGCSTYRAPVMPPAGIFYSNIEAPMDADAEQTRMGAKSGSAESISILNLFAFGDASIDTAARAGGVSTVQHVDYKYFNILGIFQKFTTVVHGE